MALLWPSKDPEEELDYTVDWAARLVTGDTISAVTWTVPTGITKMSQTNDTTKAVVWLSGGTAKQKYSVKCAVTTANGRKMEQTVTLPVAEK